MAREVWRASGGGAGQKEMKLHPLRVCFCWAVPALILLLAGNLILLPVALRAGS